MKTGAESYAAQHIGDRRDQQDKVEILHHESSAGWLMAVLADGAGGHTGGAMASGEVLLRAQQNLEAYREQGESVEELLESVLQEAHTCIRLTRFTSEKDPHSTAVVWMLRDGRAHWAHCGDSRLYLVRGGKVYLRSEDHSWANYMVRSGKLDAESAAQDARRNMLFSCLGGKKEPEITHSSEAVQVGDVFLLCSDGLWEYFSDAELASVLSRYSPREAGNGLLREVRKRARGGGDNASLAVIKITAAAAADQADSD